MLAQEGDTVDVGVPIAIIAGADDDISQYAASSSAPSAPAASPAETPPAKESAVRAEAPTPLAPTLLRGNGRMRASPVARKLAEERGVDLSAVRGTGPDGRIVLRDVESAALGTAAAVARHVGPPRPLAMSKMRQTIARRMAQSKREAPHYYVTVDIDMANAENVRHQLNDLERGGTHVSVNDLIVKASAIALAGHPLFNTWLVADEIQQHDAINVCIAIALDEGLIAPAILDCGNKTLPEISAAGRDLAQRAKSGSLRADEYTAGTFTVSNLGPYDVETLIAIIQPPQTAILGVGSVRDAAVVRDGQIVAGKLMKVALSADHRVTDGAQGAKFLNEIRGLLEKPVALLI